jgi:hypothetical protein
VRRLGVVELKVPEVVVGCLGLGNLVVRLGLAGVDDVGELDGILDEENGDVVGDNVPVALLRVELDGEPAHITDRVGTAAAAEDGREADEDGCLARRVGEDRGACDVFGALEEGEGAERAAPAGVDNALWNALMVEAVNLGQDGQRDLWRSRGEKRDDIPSHGPGGPREAWGPACPG